MLIKRNTTLFKKVENYIKWRYNSSRSVCMILVDKGGRVYVKTVLSNKEHYPVRLNNLIKFGLYIQSVLTCTKWMI